MTNPPRSTYDLLNGMQFNRILRLSFPNNDGPASRLVVNKIEAFEFLSKDFKFKVELLSDESNIAFKEMQGKLLNIELVRRDGSLRYFSGYVFSFCRHHSDGGFTIYEAELGPWLRFLMLRKNNYLFHSKSLYEQTDKILRDYGTYPKWEWRVRGLDSPYTDACQFDETDFNYLSRRWEAVGLYYWYEHNASGHILIISNDSRHAAALDGGEDVRFNAEFGAVEEDAIDLWSPVRHSMPSNFSLMGFDFKEPFPINVTLPTLNRQGIVPEIETYEYAGSYGFRNFIDGDAKCRIRLEEIEAIAKHVIAEGNNRFLMPGRWFRLKDHFNHNIFNKKFDARDTEFLILSVRHMATNNYLQKNENKIFYRNWVTCSRKNVPWRPGRSFNSVDTKIFAPQTAIVVGPSGPGSIHTDEYGRVRVQFHWDREGKNDDRSSAWIRISSSWAGAEFGATTIPRIGTEVIVQWLDGCPDHPIITGAVFNKRNMPPWEMPNQQALTGFRSRELVPGEGNLPSGRSNHLIFDDTHDRIQAQLKSDHQHSQLSLGFITRIDGNRGRTDERGEGWELRTDGHGVLRSAKGILVTTESRVKGRSYITDLDETLQRLKDAQELHEKQAKEAVGQKAQEWGQQDEIAEVIHSQNQTLGGSSEKFSELSAPHLVLASAAGLVTSTAQSTHLSSDEQIGMTAKRDVSIAAGESLFASVTQTLRLFAKNAGMTLLAAAGNISLVAKQDEIDLIAAKVITLLSENDWIELKGKKGIRLHGAGSVVEISDKVQFYTSSPTLFHGNLETLVPAKGPQSPAAIDGTDSSQPSDNHEKFDEQFKIVESDGNTPVINRRYRITAEDGKIWEGRSDDSGLTQRVTTPSPVKLSLSLLPEE